VFKKIVFGYAGDQPSRDAAVLAAQLGSLLDCELEVVYPYHLLFASDSAASTNERVRGELVELLGEQERVAHARYRWSSSSWPIRALHELADYDRAELIVLGAAPDGHRLALMQRAVHGAPCAVAIAPSGYADREHRPPQTVGVGFVDSREGRAALLAAKAIAQHAGCPLQVIAASSLSPELRAYAAASPALPAAEEEIEAETRVAAERSCVELLPNCKYELDVRRGDAAGLLIDASESLDLLVLGSRAYGPLRHALLGGVSAEVMRRSRCPLLVMPRGAAVEAMLPVREQAATRG